MLTKKLHLPLAWLLIFSLLLGACAAPAAAPVATQVIIEEPPTAVPATPVPPTAAPAKTEAPAATEPPAALSEPDVLTAFTTLIQSIPGDKGYGTIKPADLDKALKSATPPFLLDVREATEVKEGYIAGAVNIPVRMVLRNLDKLPPPDGKIVVYCGGGHRGGLIMGALRMLGYKDVVNLNGGISAWKKAGLAVTTDPIAEPKVLAPATTPNALLYPTLDKFLATLPDGYFSLGAAKVDEALKNAKPPVLVDVRTQDEWTNDGYIKGAINLPFSDFFANLSKLPADKATPIIVYCGSGNRGAIVMMGLRLLGYQDVNNINGGLGAWKSAKLPVVGWVDWNVAWNDFFTNMPADFYTIKGDVLNRAISGGTAPFLLDVREAAEVEKDGFIKGAVNIPIRDLLKNLDKLPAMDKPIVVYCGVGHRGAMAMAGLRLLGYTDVRNLSGGFSGWKKATFAVETGTPVAPVAGTAPEVDTARMKGLNAFYLALPENFYLVMSADLDKELKSEAKPVVIDTRPAEEFAKEYIDGSINIPINDFLKDMTRLPADKATAIVTTCQSGHRGAMAMMALHMLGYTNVRSLFLGVNGWKDAKLPVLTQ